MNITGKARVWANEHQNDRGVFNTYSLSIGSKRQDGTWINAYQKVKFKGDLPRPENGEWINVTNAFPSVDEWEDKTNGNKRTQVVWVITEYEKMDSAQKNIKEPISGFASLTEEDVPF